MRSKFLLLTFGFLFITSMNAQLIENGQPKEEEQKTIKEQPEDEDSRYWSVGIIPYQVLSRSSAVYLSIDLGRVNLESRLAYTYDTDHISWMGPFKHDNFFFSGINNYLLIGKTTTNGFRAKFIMLYRHWEYRNRWVPIEGVSMSSSYSWNERMSKKADGFGIGVDFSQDFSYKMVDLGFFTNISGTYFNAVSDVYEADSNRAPPQITYPRIDRDSWLHLSIAIGIKVGIRRAYR